MNPSAYRYVNYIATRILLAEELGTQQQIDRLVDANSNPTAYQFNALYRPGALFNVTLAISGFTVTLSPTNTGTPMLVMCRGIWEPFTCGPIAMGSSTHIYLNYVVVSQPQTSGDAEMAELQISVSNTDTSGPPNSGASELERNASPISMLAFTTPGGVLTYSPVDNVIAQAQASNFTSGLVKLTTGTSSGTALASDDPAVTNQRVPVDASVTTAKVAAVVTSGTNTDGSATVNPTAVGQGGINATKLIYAPGTQTVEAAITAASAGVAAVESTLTAHIGQALGPGVHPMPTYVQVGAAPISHVGSALDGQHIPSITSDTTGFTVTRNPANAPITGNYAYLLRDNNGTVVGGITHSGDFESTSPYYPSLIAGLAVLQGHVSQVSHANPHGLALSDLGGCSLTQETTDVANLQSQITTLDGMFGATVRAGQGYTWINGILVQWGSIPASNGVFSFQTPFPTVCFQVFVSNSNAMGALSDPAYGYVIDTGTFFAGTKDSQDGSLSAYSVAWWALGN